jgi:hypothetical protein
VDGQDSGGCKFSVKDKTKTNNKSVDLLLLDTFLGRECSLIVLYKGKVIIYRFLELHVL